MDPREDDAAGVPELIYKSFTQAREFFRGGAKALNKMYAPPDAAVMPQQRARRLEKVEKTEARKQAASMLFAMRDYGYSAYDQLGSLAWLDA